MRVRAATVFVYALFLAAPAWAGQFHTSAIPVDDRQLTITSHIEVPSMHGGVRLILDDSYALAPLTLDPLGQLHRRLGSAMFDFYPSGNRNGFHLSAGLHYYSRRNSYAEAFRVGRSLLYIPRNRGLAPGGGFRRYTPAATLGYNEHLAHNLMLGIEGGALFGRAVDAQPLRDLRIADRGALGPNPVASMVLGFRF